MSEIAALLLTVLLLQTPSLDSPTPQERLDAIEAMTRQGARENVPALAAALKKEPRREVRAAIVSGLARIQSPEVVPVLADTLRSDLEKDVRLQAIDSLQRLYIPTEEPAGSIRTIFNRVKSVFSEPDRPVVGERVLVDLASKEALSGAMQMDFNQEVRAAAARALGSLKARDQVPVLITTLENPQNREHKAVRLEIIQSLGLIRDPAAGPALERALGDSDDQIVAAAVLAIGLTRYTVARPQVENLFRSSRNRQVRRNSLQSLALLIDPALTPFFEALLAHSDDVYRELAAEGLARLHYDAPGLKVRLTVEEKPNARNAVAFALASSNHNEYINDLANALDSRQVNQAEAYLEELGRFEGKLPELYRYLQSSNPKVRAGMARVLGNIGDPASRPSLEAMRQDPDLEVLREATAALRRMSAQ